ncbi:TetR/AcrR family transcriptional regulator [Halanaerobiaceae bacterium Z-7014]|uniref:TetR/AcrR family transcriptional regulator n=1 Tax=Halonatronomonas betaini TaxID=2778430 RepID=A0A931ASJ2_9FIRM|nr:TetR/AcrR family transcriptional regulator [Halonatronomonas betaini]MBF8435834.1 TetR/AcrR family transcriptional regulator [Halonatronomonas betaini]
MPTDTFFNINEDKRERIIEAGIAEFSRNSFGDASISNIIEMAEIPRGSFYQYFDDLKDFYKYIISFIAERKIAFFNRSFSEMESLDTFEMIRELYRLGIKFAYENPRIAAIGNYFASESDDLKNEIYENFEDRSRQFFINIIDAGKANGDINQEVDSQTVARILYFINMSITDEFLDGVDLSNLEAADLDNYYDFIEKMLFILKHGIAE